MQSGMLTVCFFLPLQRNLELRQVDGMAGSGVDDHEEGYDCHSDAYHLIYIVDDADVVVVAHLVHSPCQDVPPQQRAYDDEEEADGLGYDVVDDDEGEHREGGDEEEDDERIGERDGKAGDEVLEQCAFVALHGLQVFLGLRHEGVDSERKEQDSAYHLEPHCNDGVFDDVDHEFDAEAGDDGIDEVRQGCAASGGKAFPASAVEGALDAEYAYRPHGCRRYDADEQSFHYHFYVAGVLQPVLEVCVLGQLRTYCV